MTTAATTTTIVVYLSPSNAEITTLHIELKTTTSKLRSDN